MSISIIILALNSFWLAYLTYLFYIRNKSSSSRPNPEFIKNSFTKIHLASFNPFDDLTGQHSFILFLLDKTNSGVIITSLQHRTSSRLYAKTIKNGQADQNSLSKEESDILKNLIKNN